MDEDPVYYFDIEMARTYTVTRKVRVRVDRGIAEDRESAMRYAEGAARAWERNQHDGEEDLETLSFTVEPPEQVSGPRAHAKWEPEALIVAKDFEEEMDA